MSGAKLFGRWLAAGVAAALGLQAFGAQLRAGHPRMFFNSDTWPAVKARAEGPAKSDLKKLLQRCDAYPAEPKCSGTDPVVFGEVKTATGTHKITAATPIKAIREWGAEAAECALAWRFTGKREYLAKAKKMLEVSIAGYHEAYRNGRAVCWYSTSRILALTAYDWIFEALTPDERRAIIVPLIAHVVETQHPKKKIIRRNSGGVKTGFYGVESLAWYAGLAAAGDGFCDETAAELLEKGRRLGFEMLKFRAEGAGDDGALSSAVPGYCLGAYPWAHFNFMHTYRSAFGENLAKDYPGLALFPNWIYWTWIPNALDDTHPMFSGFGDTQHGLNDMPVSALGQHMTQYMEFFKEANPKAARLAAALRARGPKANMSSPWPMYPFIMGGAEDVKAYSEAELDADLLCARHFETLGQFLMRSGRKTDSTYCTFTSGAKLRMHKHHDENNFVIYKHDFLALDSGTRGIETDWNLKYYYAQSVAHNVVLIHKPNEPLPGYWGPKYDGPEGKTNYGGMYDAVATPLAFETNDYFTYIASDATECYGAKCTESVRQFVHVLPDVFVVYDRVGAADAAYRKEWLLHTQNEPAIDGNVMRADCGKGRLFCETLLPKGAGLKKVGGPGREFWANGKNWEMDERYRANAMKAAERAGRGPYFGNWRLEVTPGAPSANDRFLHVLTAADTSVAAGVVAKDASDATRDGVTIVVPNHVRGGVMGTMELTLRFNREGTVGGDVRVAFTPAGGVAQVQERSFTAGILKQSGFVGMND